VNARHLQLAPPPASPSRVVHTRKEIEEWAAERRKVLTELAEREGLGRQLTLGDERRAA
jgi:hypothetical protein